MHDKILSVKIFILRTHQYPIVKLMLCIVCINVQNTYSSCSKTYFSHLIIAYIYYVTCPYYQHPLTVYVKIELKSHNLIHPLYHNNCNNFKYARVYVKVLFASYSNTFVNHCLVQDSYGIKNIDTSSNTHDTFIFYTFYSNYWIN